MESEGPTVEGGPPPPKGRVSLLVLAGLFFALTLAILVKAAMMGGVGATGYFQMAGAAALASGISYAARAGSWPRPRSELEEFRERRRREREAARISRSGSDGPDA